MEYLENGDLFGYLHQRPPLPETEAKEITYQILEGLGMMHENGFAHRDLKPNVRLDLNSQLALVHKDGYLEHPGQIAPSSRMVDQTCRLWSH